MNREIRILYFFIVALLIVFGYFTVKLSYNLGVSKGKLEKMEEFRSVFMPNPANVFPDATPIINEEG